MGLAKTMAKLSDAAIIPVKTEVSAIASEGVRISLAVPSP
jgi:hypothetical protein